MKWKPLWDFFYYTRTEKRGVAVLLLLCALVFVVPHWFKGWPAALPEVQEAIPIQRFSPTTSPSAQRVAYRTSAPRRVQYRPFDPNQVTYAELLSMGVPSKVAAIWQKYRSKGGHFRRSEDLQRIYGMTDELYQRLVPYVRLEPHLTGRPSAPRGFAEEFPPSDDHSPRRRKPCTPFDVNAGDTLQWQALPLIGRVLAARITNYRQKLGGFYAIEQVGETFGLADSVFQLIRPCLMLENPRLMPLRLNKATFAELNAHPYISFSQAKALVAYRDQHGKFAQVADLMAVKLITADDYRRLEPYLSVED